jgi:hypothetical protein
MRTHCYKENKTKEMDNTIKELLEALENKLNEANDIVEQLRNHAYDFNRKDGKYDFKLDPKNIHGQLIEVRYSKHITSDNIERQIGYEIKSEGPHSWIKSGNLYIEFEQFKDGEWVDSGISITEADMWVHVLKDENGNILHSIEVSTSWLKNRIYELNCQITKKERTGDGTATKAYLVPLKDLYHTPSDYTKFKQKINAKKILKNK